MFTSRCLHYPFKINNKKLLIVGIISSKDELIATLFPSKFHYFVDGIITKFTLVLTMGLLEYIFVALWNE